MKKSVIFYNAFYFIIISFLFNSYMLVKHNPLLLIVLIPLYIIMNVFPGIKPEGTKRMNLRICNHGAVLLAIFAWSLIPSVLWHIFLAVRILPDGLADLLFSALYCVISSAIVFWNGIICVYCTSSQMGIKWRVIGAICCMIPVANLIVLTKIINITSK